MNINQNTIKKAIIPLFIYSLLFGSFLVHAEVLGKIVAVVEDDDVLEQDQPLRGVGLADLHTQRIPGVDDHRELRVVERPRYRRQ